MVLSTTACATDLRVELNNGNTVVAATLVVFRSATMVVLLTVVLLRVVYIFAISSRLISVPKINANTPKMNTKMFLMMTQLPGPKPISQYVTISMKIGIIRPKMEKQKAPMRPINGPMVGTATASKTVNTNNRKTIKPRPNPAKE